MELPIFIKRKFEKLKKQLGKLGTIEIPRCFSRDAEKLHFLHVFCDAIKITNASVYL